MTYQLILSDCLEELSKIESSSIDAIFSDPPYPYIKRDYGYWTEETWFPMMQEVVRQSKRILKVDGSAVFILQPNSEKVGQMRPWLWKFLVWCLEEWNIVQDAYYQNTAPLPNRHSNRKFGLMRTCIKNMIWLGESNCFRNQELVLCPETKANAIIRNSSNKLEYRPSGYSIRQKRIGLASLERGGVTPINLFSTPNNGSIETPGSYGHGAGTPIKLTDWWLRYICKPEGTVLDMFSGTGTTGVAARRLNLNYIGIEKMEKYHKVAEHRLETALDIKLDKQTQQLREDTEMLF